MKAYQIIGGRQSPSVILLARSVPHARSLYNAWLKKHFGYEDHGVGIHQMTENTIYSDVLTSFDINVKPAVQVLVWPGRELYSHSCRQR